MSKKSQQIEKTEEELDRERIDKVMLLCEKTSKWIYKQKEAKEGPLFILESFLHSLAYLAAIMDKEMEIECEKGKEELKTWLGDMYEIYYMEEESSSRTLNE